VISHNNIPSPSRHLPLSLPSHTASIYVYIYISIYLHSLLLHFHNTYDNDNKQKQDIPPITSYSIPSNLRTHTHIPFHSIQSNHTFVHSTHSNTHTHTHTHTNHPVKSRPIYLVLWIDRFIWTRFSPDTTVPVYVLVHTHTHLEHIHTQLQIQF